MAFDLLNTAKDFLAGVGTVFTAPFDQGRALVGQASRPIYSTQQYNAPSTPSPQSYRPPAGSSNNAGNDALAAAQRLLDQVRSYQPPVPKIASLDVSGVWNKAKEMANNAVSPIYQQKMNDFIARQQVELARQKSDTDTAKGALDTTLSRNLEDTGTARTRTQEDTNTNIADINASQEFASREGGLDYDAAQRALIEGVSAAGTADTGMGRQQVNESARKYSSMSNEQVRQADNKVAASKTLLNRTFEDLEREDTRNTEDTSAKKGRLDLDLERFIEDQNFDRDQEQKNQEIQKQQDIYQQANQYQGQLVNQWIQSLKGAGYSDADIAATAAVYK